MATHYIILFIVAITATWWIYRKVHRIAVLKGITDNPDGRKLQKKPVPVLGGAAVFFGMVVALLVAGVEFEASKTFTVVCAFTIMLYVGTMDDILSLSPYLRLAVEILVISLLIYGGCGCVDDFHGLWGIHRVPDWIAVPLTVFACVGIINAINLLDGVNGLSSGYCIMACIAFGGAAIWSGDVKSATFAVISIGSLIPFFSHNVFGKKSRMFIGDGGTLLMGTIMAYFVINALKGDSPLLSVADESFGHVAFTLAILDVPVFDTIRVMGSRILGGTSPFRPDKTHLHHLLISLGFSHVGTTLTEISLSVVIFCSWLASWRLGASIDAQLYVVLAMGFLSTFGVYWYGSTQERHKGRAYRFLAEIGEKTHVGHKKWFEGITKFLDRNYNDEETDGESR